MSIYELQPVAILWDIENCAVPRGVNPEDVAVHIRLFLKVQLALGGRIAVFSAYGDFAHLSSRIRQGCQRTGVNLINVPHGSNDAADKAILVDMFLFALDNPPPCTVVLISGDVDFAPALHKLGQRGYCVVLIQSGLHVSPALSSSCQHLWSWPDVARGKGLIPGKPPLTCVHKETWKPSQAIAGNAGCNDSSKNELINGVKGSDHGVDMLEAGPSGKENARGVPRKLPIGIFEESVKVPDCFIKDPTQNPVVMGVGQNGMQAFDRSRLLSCGAIWPAATHSMMAYEDCAPLNSQARDHGYPFGKPGAYTAGKENFGHIWKGRANCNASMAASVGTAGKGPLLNIGNVVACRTEKFVWRAVRGRDNPSTQSHSSNAQRQTASCRFGESTYKQAAHDIEKHCLSKVKKTMKKKKNKKLVCDWWLAPKTAKEVC